MTGEVPWAERGNIAPLFLPNCQPVKMQDGNWLMAGRVASRLGTTPRVPPAVAISAGDRLRHAWSVVRLQAEELPPGHHPETTVWMDGSELIAFTRNSLGRGALCVHEPRLRQDLARAAPGRF